MATIGASDAIGWLIGDSVDVISCGTLTEALEQASAYARSQALVAPSAAKLAAYGARTATHARLARARHLYFLTWRPLDL